MKPVQTKQHDPPRQNGNCFAACVASILECSIEELPRFEDMPGIEWWSSVLTCAKEKGFAVNYFSFSNANGDQIRIHEDDLPQVVGLPKNYSILSGKSPRGDWDHCVVAYDGIPVFDPQPLNKNGEKLLNYLDWIWFEPSKGSEDA